MKTNKKNNTIKIPNKKGIYNEKEIKLEKNLYKLVNTNFTDFLKK